MTPTPQAVTTREKVVVVEVARARWLLWTSVGCAITAAGVWWGFRTGHVPDKVKYVLEAILAACSLGTCVWWILSGRQLLIGETRVMLIARRTKRLVGHVLYDDIESVHFHHGDADDILYRPGVAIRVRANHGPMTFWPGLFGGETDIVIQDRFVKEPAVLRKMLRKRWEKYRFAREKAEKPPGGFSADMDVTG